MNAIAQKPAFLLFLFLLFSSGLIAQQNRFIYIQTENKQGFYVKLDKKLFSSSASGYLIIPKLKDGTYELFIGFPKNEWPEQKVTCTINKTDAGFMLKNFGEKGWGLFNLQTMQVLMSEKKTIDNKAAVIEENYDAFSTILADVVNDPSIRQKSIVQAVTEEVSPANITAQKAIVKEEAKPVPDKVEISKLIYDNKPDGVTIAYVDVVNGIADTINVFIPAEKGKKTKKSKTEQVKKAAKVEEDLAKNNMQIDSTLKVANEIVQASRDTVKKKTVKPVLANTNCKIVASRIDFLNLRTQMTATEDYDDMISLAIRSFKKKCFTTEQVKNLSTLFLRDE
ncbi:MAG TPA: hypothetical protein VK484_01255, partial [Ferruginibacter sp.]|nr:hypothetical protein [Ferruginibacter sp.]